MSEKERRDPDGILRLPSRSPYYTPEPGEAAYVNMPLDKVNQAYRSFVTIMDMIADQGDNVSERMVLEAIDDILSAWLDARETREMLRYIVVGALTGDIAPDAEMEIAKTRHYLTEQGC